MSFAIWDFIFQPFLFQIRSSGGFYLCRTNLHGGLTRLQQGWSVALLVLLPTRLSKPHTALHKPSCGFVSQNEFTPPPKGGGAGLFSHSGCLGLLDSSTAGSHRFNGAGNPFRWCRSPTWPAKSHTGSHRAEFGFCLLPGASQEDHPPFRQSRIRTQAEEKNTSAPLF